MRSSKPLGARARGEREGRRTGALRGARAVLVVMSALGAAHAVASCAEAGGDVTGGGLTEAGVRATTPPSGAGVADASDPRIAELVARACPTPQWAGLYEDVFGNGQPGSCNFTGSCHEPGGPGAISGSGIECFDEQGCCVSMFERGLVQKRNGATPDRAPLIGVLRRRVVVGDAGSIRGIMPQLPSDYVYSTETLDRVRDWIRLVADDAGAPVGDAATDAGDEPDATDTTEDAGSDAD